MADSVPLQEQATIEFAMAELQVETLRAAISTLPEGHLDLRELYLELVKLLHNRFLDTNELEHLEELINLQRQIVAWSRLYDSENGLFWACHYLAISLVMQIEVTGDDAVLPNAIDLHREALGLTRPGHPGRPLSCVHLSIALLLQYETAGEEDILQDSLAFAEEAISLCPAGHPDRALACGHLARVLTLVHERSADDVEVLSRIIELESEGLSLRAETEKSTLMGNLSASLYLYYQATGDPAYLNEAITLQRTAISLRTSDEEDRVLSCLQLSPLLSAQFELTGDVSYINEAIQSAREALVLCPSGHRNRYPVCENLAKCIHLLCLQTGDGEKLGEAVALRRECLDIRPPGHLDRLAMGTNLANTLRFRFECTGDERLLYEAILVVEDVLKQCPDGDTRHRADALALLASLANSRFERTAEYYFLNEAILKINEAISLRPSTHPGYAKWCSQLAVYLTTLYDRTGELDVLEYVVATERNVLALYSPGNIQRPEVSTNLAASLVTLFDVKKDSGLITEAIELCTEAVSDSHPSQAWRPWTLLCHAYLKDDTEYFNVNAAITSLTIALAPGAQGLTPLILATVRILDIIWSIVELKSMPQSLVTTYGRLIGLLPTQANFALDRHAQLKVIASCSHVGSDAFVAAVSVGLIGEGLELLESAQGIMWSQALRLREPDLADTPAHVAEELKDLLRAVAAPGSADHPENGLSRHFTLSQDALHQANARIQTLLGQVRETPGMEGFMLSTAFETLMKVASRHPVALLVAARKRCYAMILKASHEPHIMTLEFDLADFNFHDILSGQRGETNEGETVRGARVNKAGKPTLIQRRLAILWHSVVKPILDHLGLQRASGRARPRIHWCPTGSMSFVPLHAAGIYHGPTGAHVNCSNFVISSYAPTITALIRAQNGDVRLRLDEIRLLLVAEKRAAEAGLATIPGVDEELRQIQNVIHHKDTVEILGGAEFPGGATVDRVLRGIQKANIVHLACHGKQNTDDPLESGFCLSDGRLTITKLMDMQLRNAFLAFCSACETSKGSSEQPDQVLHLAAAMLFAGFKNVIATMWAVSDVDGPKIARWVYEELHQQEVIDSDSVAYALDLAVDKLRRSGLPPERWAPFVHVGA